MKNYQKFSTVLLACLIVIAFMFVPGNSASAHEGDDCGCRSVDGAERNKVIANMLKNDEFKADKEALNAAGYQWNGVANFEVDYNAVYDAYLVAMPLVHESGVLHYYLYVFGDVVGPVPPELAE